MTYDEVVSLKVKLRGIHCLTDRFERMAAYSQIGGALGLTCKFCKRYKWLIEERLTAEYYKCIIAQKGIHVGVSVRMVPGGSIGVVVKINDTGTLNLFFVDNPNPRSRHGYR